MCSCFVGTCFTMLSAQATQPFLPSESYSNDKYQSTLMPWVRGFYEKAHNSQNDGFNADIKGMVYGIDTQIGHDWLLRLGYTRSHVRVKDMMPDTTGNGHNYFVSATYQPDKWYVQTTLNYGHQKYKQQQDDITMRHRSDTYTADFVSGYHFGVAHNYSGLRYHYTKPDAYLSAGERIEPKNTQILTAVIGTEVSKKFKQNDLIEWQPSFRLSGSYDFKSDGARATVFVSDAYTSFTADAYRLHRAALQTGVGLTTHIGRFSLSADYDIEWRVSHFTQTGLLQMQYAF